MNKYQFRIRTRSGVVVESVSIAGKDRPDAERKLYQIYEACQVLEVHESDMQTRREATDIDSIISLISRQDGDAGH